MNRWIVGSRPRTLPAAIVPVALGAVVAVGEGGAVWTSVPLAAVVALALQVGVNYANDYSDGVRGTDDERVGPVRLVASGLATARAVKVAAIGSFGVAAAVGLVLAAMTTWWLLVIGAACILAGWFYTGGPRPYGYAGFGEVFVFVFFGLVATAGTTYVVLERLPAASWWLGTSTGALSCALLVTNNLRDVPTDRLVGKNTLAVRLGVERTRILYVALIAVSFVTLIVAGVDRPEFLVGLLAVPLAVRPVRDVLAGASGRELVPILGGTGRIQLVVGVLVVASTIVLG
ncbi:MAG: 1,4-dihydroxy-2-naphthoate octaprenyltransferase [Actinomycetota bacterium]